MNKTFGSIFASVLLLGQSVFTLCGPMDWFSDIGKILKPRWSVSEQAEYINDGFQYQVTPLSKDGYEALSDEKKAKYKIDKCGHVFKIVASQKIKIKEKVADGRFVDVTSEKNLREVPKMSLYIINNSDGSTKSFGGVPFIDEVKTVESDTVKNEMKNSLHTEWLKSPYRFMLGNKVMKLWFASVWSGVAVGVAAGAYQLHKRFIQPRMEKLTRELAPDQDELMEHDDIVVQQSNDVLVENSVDQLEQDIEESA